MNSEGTIKAAMQRATRGALQAAIDGTSSDANRGGICSVVRGTSRLAIYARGDVSPEAGLRATHSIEGMLLDGFRLWPHSTGHGIYPVPGGAAEFACNARLGTMWSGGYGELRRDLARFLIGNKVI